MKLRSLLADCLSKIGFSGIVFTGGTESLEQQPSARQDPQQTCLTTTPASTSAAPNVSEVLELLSSRQERTGQKERFKVVPCEMLKKAFLGHIPGELGGPSKMSPKFDERSRRFASAGPKVPNPILDIRQLGKPDCLCIP